MNLDHFRKSNHVTEELVEQAAIVAWEDVRNRANVTLPSWDNAEPVVRYETRANVLAVLNMITPVLLEQGWLPPVVNDAVRSIVDEQNVNELHKNLMSHIMADRENSGHTTQQGLDGYSEGVEHGTLSIAGHIKAALDQVPTTKAQDIAAINAGKVRRIEILRNQLEGEGMNANIVALIWQALEPTK